jgi:hypothetical protein
MEVSGHIGELVFSCAGAKSQIPTFLALRLPGLQALR